jgi:hypothetical protein
MREHAVLQHGRLQGGRHQQRRGDDEAIDEHHLAALRCTEHGAGHEGDLEATQGRQSLQRVLACACRCSARVTASALRATPGIKAGAGADAFLHRRAGEGRHQRQRLWYCRSHLAEAQHIGLQRFGELEAGLQAASHCGAVIAGASQKLAVPARSCGQQAIALAEIMIDAGIDDISAHSFWRAKMLIAAPPARKFSTICQVTLCG